MNYFAVFKGRTRALITDLSSLAVFIVIVLACVFIAKNGEEKDLLDTPVAVVNLDEGNLGERLSNILLKEEYYTFYLTNEAEAEKAISKSKAQGMVVIKPDFTEKILAEDINSLVEVTVMSDTYEFNNFTEFVINDTIKIWLETYAQSKLMTAEGMTEEEINLFLEETDKMWNEDSLIKIQPYLLGDAKEEEGKNTYPGIRWYAALTLFYLMVSGIWMCQYGSGHLLKRAVGRGCNIALLFLAQSLPGICITAIGLIPVLLAGPAGAGSFRIIAAYIIYVIGASGMALVFCSIAGKLSNLVMIVPAVTMGASLMSGLLFRLPDWAGFWEIVSMIFPGRWFQRAVMGETYLFGCILVSAAWFALGMLVSWIFLLIHTNNAHGHSRRID